MKTISNILLKTSTVIRRAGKRLAKDSEWTKTMKEWNRLNEVRQFRTNYPELDSQSVVFDLGGYKGQFAANIFSQYLSYIYVFEPHPTFVSKITSRFSKNDKIKIFPYGIGESDETLMMSSNADSSSVFEKEGSAVEIKIVEAEKFFQQNNIDVIDLIKINIEGGEYGLLDHLIETGRIKKMKNIQVQFHDFVPNAEQLMSDLHLRLAATHETTYAYKFFWENWKLKE